MRKRVHARPSLSTVVGPRSRIAAIGIACLTAVAAALLVASPAHAGDGPPPTGPDVKPPTQPVPPVRPAPVPEQAGTQHGVVAVTSMPGGVTKVALYEPAPGFTDQQLYAALKRQQIQGLQDPAAIRPFTANTCTWGTATTLACPQVHWARNGHAHPQIYFVDHTSDAWPVTAAVPVWNEANGVDSWYRWASCPNVSGAHCVHVFNSDYGDTGWVGLTIFQYDGNRNFIDGDTIISLNDHYAITAARHRKSTCHELGHALGLGHNSSAASCLIPGDYTPQRPNGDDFALAHDIYTSF